MCDCAAPWLSGSGEMASRIRDFDWAKTPIGPAEGWPAALKVAVQLMLALDYPAHLCVGEGWTHLYNDNCAGLMGFRHPDALGRDIRITFADADFASALARAFQGETIAPTGDRKGVSERAWLDMSATPVRDEHGSVLAVLILHEGTTAERTREEVAAREAFLLRLSDALRSHSDPAVAAMRHLAEYLDVERAAYYEVGADQDTFFLAAKWDRGEEEPMAGAMRMSDLRPDVADSYRAGRTVICRDSDRQAIKDSRRRASSGIRAWVGVPLVKEGRLFTVVCVHSMTARDWTSAEVRLIEEVAQRTSPAVERARAEQGRRESEERFRRFVENVHEYAFVEVNPQGSITSWNPGAERLFGFSSGEVIGMPFSALAARDSAQKSAVEQEIDDVGRGAKREEAQWLTRKGGSRFWARWVSEAIYDADGRIRGIAKVMRDETERQEADLSLRRSLAEKEALLKEVHHRVKNNLQVISSLLNLQARDIEDERVLALFDQTRYRVYAIAAIHELLYRSSSCSSIDLAEYARYLGPQLLRSYALQGRVHLEVEGHGVTLELERAVAFGLLLNELISNACKHAFPDGRSGKVTTSLIREGEAIRLEVSDDGVSFPAEVDSQCRSSLGMKLIHMLANQLGGDTQVMPGPGGRVLVRFPPARASEDRS